MSEEIMVSVICTVYNHEKYLRKCLDGFVMQKTNFKFEVLIHDDASTDGSADIIREYEKKYPDIIKPIYQTVNQYSQGIKVSQTYLYPRAKGKYLAFCEGDDYWCDENKLQKQFDVMEANNELSACLHRVSLIKEAGELTGDFYPRVEMPEGIKSTDEMIRLLFKSDGYPFHTSSIFVKTEYVIDLTTKDVLFYKESPAGDFPMYLYFALMGKIYYFDESMSCYRLFSIGSYTERQKKNKEFYIKNLKSWLLMYNEFNLYTNRKYNDILQTQLEKTQFELLFCLQDYRKIIKMRNTNVFKKLSNKEKIWIILNAYFPHIMKLYKKSKDKNNA